MKLGNLLDSSTVKSLYAVTVAPWHSRSDQERMLDVQAACMASSKKIGQFMDKRGRMACTETIPYGRKLLTEWVTAHASALAMEKPRLGLEGCMEHGLYDVLSFYGYSRSFGSFANDFDRFQVR